MSEAVRVEPDLDLVRRLNRLSGESLKKCYQCATCSVVCERSPAQDPFPRKEMIWAQWGLGDRLAADPDLWLCFQCSDCTLYCPRGAKPGEVLAAARAAAVEKYAIPRFLPRALASPRALPLLLLFSAAVILLLVYFSGSPETGWGFSVPTPEPVNGRYAGGYFANFLEHGPVEMVFVGGNLLVFLLVMLSLRRFWNDLGKAGGPASGPSFTASLVRAAVRIATHSPFRDCRTEGGRYFSHLMVFYGFLGAMATAGLALFDLKVLGHEPPLPFWNPIKILGNASFLLLVGGTLWMMGQRLGRKPALGKGNYQDWLFLVILFLVALTGGLTQLGRHLALASPTPAYVLYFIHITCVFFLLWFAPYSKFAHLFYRTLAMVFAESSGRIPGRSGGERARAA